MLIGSRSGPHQVTAPTKVTVGLISWQIDEDGIDIRRGDSVSWVVLVVPPAYFRSASENRPVGYLFDTYGLTQASEVGGQLRYVRIEGVVESVEAVNRPRAVAAGAPFIRKVESTHEATVVSSDGAIVTFAEDATAEPSSSSAHTGEVEVRRPRHGPAAPTRG